MLRLKELRNSPENPTGKKISQQKMAEILQVSRSTIGMWETGASDPDTDALKNIADYFNVSIDYVLGRYSPLENQVNSFDISEEERTFLSRFRRLDARDRAYIEGQLAAFLLSDKYQ